MEEMNIFEHLLKQLNHNQFSRVLESCPHHFAIKWIYMEIKWNIKWNSNGIQVATLVEFEWKFINLTWISSVFQVDFKWISSGDFLPCLNGIEVEFKWISILMEFEWNFMNLTWISSGLRVAIFYHIKMELKWISSGFPF